MASFLWTGGFLVLFLFSVVLYFTDPAMQRANIRELADEIETRTGRGDVVLLPYQDYAFDYYFQGPATSLYLETRVGDRDLLNWVLPQMQDARRAVLRWVHTLRARCPDCFWRPTGRWKALLVRRAMGQRYAPTATFCQT